MKRLFMTLTCLMCMFGAYADNNNTATSKDYVDAQIETLQDEISAIDSNTVLTHTGTSGEIGSKKIYDANTDYMSQTDALVTAGTFNTAVQNAIDNEFVCIDWLGEHVPGNCLLWQIRPISGKNLFNKYDPKMQFNGYFNAGTNYKLIDYNGGDKVVFIHVEPNTTYTIQRTIPNSIYNRFRVGTFNTVDVPVGKDQATDVLFDTYDLETLHVTVTTKSDTTYLGIFCRNSGTVGPDWQEYLDTFQVERGDVATEYEPYQNLYLPTGN